MPLAGVYITLFMRVGKTAETEQKQDYDEQQRIPGNSVKTYDDKEHLTFKNKSTEQDRLLIDSLRKFRLIKIFNPWCLQSYVKKSCKDLDE